MHSTATNVQNAVGYKLLIIEDAKMRTKAVDDDLLHHEYFSTTPTKCHCRLVMRLFTEFTETITIIEI